MGLDGIELDRGGLNCMGTVCIFLNPTAKILMQDVGISTLYPVQISCFYEVSFQ